MTLFTKENRLRSKEDFKSVSLGGKRINSPSFTIFYRRGKSTLPKLGITASRKCGIAVKRNYCKRRIREMFRSYIERLPQDLEIHLKVHSTLESNDESLYQEFQTKLVELISSHSHETSE